MLKKLNTKIVMVVLVALLTSCLGDLDPKSQGPNLPDAASIFKTKADYKSGLAKLYASFALSGTQGPAGQGDISGLDEGFGQYMRAYWNAQELTTDEAVIGWDDQTIKDFHWHTWTPTDVFLAAMYYRILYTVTICNEYIRATQGNADTDIIQYAQEARFLRALAYWHGLDLFGNIPIVTENDKPGSYLPKQATRAELFAYIESELTDIEAGMGNPQFEYARADKGACWMLQAKLYLNAVVYTGEEKYTEALTALNKVIAASYTLEPVFLHNFLADNHTSSEVIFPIAFDGTHTQTYGGTTYIINAQIGGSMDREGTFGSKSGWGGLRTTSAIVDVFAAGDGRALFWTNGQNKEINNIGQFTDGYAVMKYRNLTSTGELAPNVAYSANGDTFMDTDFPLFRLADAYLMYAEAVLRGGTGGSIGQAVDYINDLRERAYGNTNGNIISTDLTLNFILDERARELYWEGHRRTDLIRYGRFSGGSYLWPWKGNVKNGAATEEHLDLFPIPSSELAANPTMDQNDGYVR